MISGKYKLRILWDLKDGALRYGEIRSGLLRGVQGSAEIAPRVLSRELKALAQTGLIDRKDYGVGTAQGGVPADAQGTQLRSRHRGDPQMGRAPPGGIGRRGRLTPSVARPAIFSASR